MGNKVKKLFIKVIETIKGTFCLRKNAHRKKKKKGKKNIAFLRKLKYSGNVLFTDSQKNRILPLYNTK